MEFLSYLIVLILKGLIKLGDFILWLIDSLIKTSRIFVTNLIKRERKISPVKRKGTPLKKKKAGIFPRKSKFSKYFAVSTKKIKKAFLKSAKAFYVLLVNLKNVFIKIFSGFKKVGFFLKKTFLKLKIFRLPRLRKRKRVKSVTVFPAPLSLKIKYILIGGFFSLVFIFLPMLFFVFLQGLPNPGELSLRDIAQTTKIYDRNGTLLYQVFANQNRTLVPLSSIPKNLKNATIAIEDKDFYKNPGFDIAAIVRAAIADLSGEPLQGGSTITQQLVKSTLLTPEISINRKVKEIILAFWAERMYSKDQILEMYFNQVPYGGTAWGIEAAAQTYFGKSVKDLNLAQSAFLAGMPRAPSIYSPYGETPNLWKKRQKEVLSRMRDLKYITRQQEEEVLKEDLVFLAPRTPIYAPHFVMYVKDYLVQKYGLPIVEKGGLNVVTTLDLKTQEMAEDVVRKEVEKNAFLNLTNGASLITSPQNGDIIAMVGSKDYYDLNSGKVNLTTSLRQPGSSIKIITYSAALSHGFTAATILNDSPVTFTSSGGPSYSPVNYDGRFHGKIPLRLALANSLNIPAVKTLNKIGVETMIDLAKKMGITTWNEPQKYGLALTLGAAEVKMTDMAVVYGSLANGGEKVELNPILKITDYKGTVVEEKKEVEKKEVLNPGVAYIISNILADNKARSIEFGTNSPLNIPGYTVSVKTGTSDEKRDNWTIGYTPSYLVAVWVGNNDNSPMSQILASGITGAAPIWHNIMTNLLSKESKESIKIPANIVIKNCFGYPEYFLKETANSSYCPATSSAALIPPNQNRTN